MSKETLEIRSVKGYPCTHVERAAGEPARALDELEVLIRGFFKAEMLSPLTVILSPSRSRIIILRALCARNRSPVPAATFRSTPSPVGAFLKQQPRYPPL